jgi:hypothetical protein
MGSLSRLLEHTHTRRQGHGEKRMKATPTRWALYVLCRRLNALIDRVDRQLRQALEDCASSSHLTIRV